MCRYLDERNSKGYPVNHSVYVGTLSNINTHIGIMTYTNIHDNIIYYAALRFLLTLLLPRGNASNINVVHESIYTLNLKICSTV